MTAPPDRQVLLVPYSRREDARRLGAVWTPEMRAWTIAADADKTPFRSVLPIRDRPGVEAPFLRINLVPQTSWGRNLRALMRRESWQDFARDEIYSTTGSLCLVCGGRGDQWPVEADEVWRFDDSAGVQRLNAVVPLCPACHEVRTCGLAYARGRTEAVVRHLAWVERISPKAARARVDDALSTWARRSRRQWRIDLSMMEERYGIRIEHDPARTQIAHDALIDEAERRSGRRLRR